MIYAYTRETPGGVVQKEKLEKQTEMLRAEHPDLLVVEPAPKGKRKKFDKFGELFASLRSGDVLIIPTIDRVSHSAEDFAGLAKGLRNRNITIKVLNMGEFDNSPEGDTLMRVITAMAEFDKAMIVERTRERKVESRKDMTFREGRPKKYTKQQIAAALKMLEAHTSYKRVSEATGISISTLQRAVRAEKARRSGDYSMTDAEIREYEAAVDGAEQMTFDDLLRL